MGCDIHLYREKKVKNQWKSIDNWIKEDDYYRVPYKEGFKGRNYDLFGLLCDGVRSSHTFSLKERGIPLLLSDEVKRCIDYWDSDGHSHSYLTLDELKELRFVLKNNNVKVIGQKQKDELKLLYDSIDSGNPDWDLLYPYCAWASSDDYEDFEIDVPASFMLGRDINKIIEMFPEDNNNYRIVFWFDN